MCIVCSSGPVSGWSTSFWDDHPYQVNVNGDFYGASVPGYLGFTISDLRGVQSISSTFQSFTVEQAAIQLVRAGLSWSDSPGQAAIVSFAFRSSDTTGSQTTTGFSRFTEAQIDATLVALAAWSDVAGITFTRVGEGRTGEQAFSNNATLLFSNFGQTPGNYVGFAYLPGSRDASSIAGDVFINGTFASNLTPGIQTISFDVLVHEIGHSIGLSHPSEIDTTPGARSSSYQLDAFYRENTYQYSVMSYFGSDNTGGDLGWSALSEGSVVRQRPARPSQPMMDDIAAAQRLYGPNFSTRTGDTVYGFNSNADRPWFRALNGGSELVFCVWDAGGTDTFDFSGYSTSSIIDLRQGAFSSVGTYVGFIPDANGIPRSANIAFAGNISIAIGAVIENAIGGAGNDRIQGNSADNVLRGGLGNDIIDGGLGIDTAVFSGTFASSNIIWSGQTATVVGPDGNDTITNVEFFRFSDVTISTTPSGGLRISGDYISNWMTGSIHADIMHGLAGDDVLLGQSGDDILAGGVGNDSLNGGAGVDTADYLGVRRQYVASSTSVSGNGEGTDTLISIENARFVDGVLTFDASSASAQVMRLYSATLNRVPDQGGLEANVGGLAAIGLQGLANTFVASAEFQARFGALNNQQFVEQLYQFALGRAGDAPGIASWVALLNGGASRGQVVVGFSESAENVARTAATLNAGLWVPDQQALIIARLYDATFKRLPDVGGLTGWVNALKSGTSVTDIAAAFAGSAEFQATFGALSNQAFVEQLYRFCLNREGDPGGIAGWVNALNTGTSRASVLLGFSESAEHVALTAALWLGGIRYAGFVGAPAEDVAKDMDGPQVLPDVEVIEIDYDPADLDLSFLDKDADAFVLPAVPDMPLPTVDPAAVFDGLDLALLRAEAFNNGRMMLILPETPEATPDFDLEAWTPTQRDGHWLM